MHEYGVAMGVYEAVMDAASKNDATRVISIDLELGELTHINPEQLSFCFEVVVKESLLEGANLNIIKTPPKIKCKCGYGGVLEMGKRHILCCPKCGNPLPELVSGREINVRDIKIEVEENA